MPILRRYMATSGGGSPTTLTFNTSNSSLSSTIMIPSAAQVGDLAVLFDYARNHASSTVTDVVPTGWTGIVTDGNTTGSTRMRVRCSYKLLTAGNPGSTITGLSDNGIAKVVFIFTPNATITTVTASTWNAEVSTGNPSSQTVSASGQTVPLVVLGMAADHGGTAAFSTASPSFTATVSSASDMMIAGYKIYNSSPANHTIDMGDLGSNNGLASGYLRVS